ncbi:MAG: diguanylate cyclase [Zoogloeaceae bacterium]|jgi:diguanylate cyclase|nr:diguanylate cyclase [Zoogloeaceae bacterium]
MPARPSVPSAAANATDIAREAFRQLAARRIPPTPENYRALYGEISGVPQTSESEATFPEEELKRLAALLEQRRQGQTRLVRELNEGIRSRDWERVIQPLADAMRSFAELQELTWGRLIQELFRQWENKSVPAGRKREMLAHVLSGSGNPRALFGRLEGLRRAWSEGDAADISLLDDADAAEIQSAADSQNAAFAPEAASPLPSAGKAGDLLPEFRALLADVLDGCITQLLADQPRLAEDAAGLAREVRAAVSLSQLEEMRQTLKRFTFRLALLIEDQTELRASLLKLLRLIIENIGELMEDDQWLHGQVAVIRDIVEKPLSQRALDDAEQRMKEIIFKQGQLKASLGEAREALKNILSGFVDHLADFAGATSDYHDAIERCARQISAATHISELEGVLKEVMGATRSIQLSAQRSRDDLNDAQQRARAAEERIQGLEKELSETSHMIRHDQLTGALNRRGLDEMLSKEIARAGRHDLPICVAMLDIDDFKKLNDSQGHVAGDQALIHLASVIRDVLRPQDTVARYGGEEFLIIFPDTAMEEASVAMQRLQRDLTRRFFMFQNQRLLITFSAGIAQLAAGEEKESVIKRADAAMYAAKKSGKNRVMLSE